MRARISSSAPACGSGGKTASKSWARLGVCLGAYLGAACLAVSPQPGFAKSVSGEAGVGHDVTPGRGAPTSSLGVIYTDDPRLQTVPPAAQTPPTQAAPPPASSTAVAVIAMEAPRPALRPGSPGYVAPAAPPSRHLSADPSIIVSNEMEAPAPGLRPNGAVSDVRPTASLAALPAHPTPPQAGSASLAGRPAPEQAPRRAAPPTASIAKGPGRALVDKAAREAPSPHRPATGEVGFALADLDRGVILERRAADAPFIPASVAKVPTALYALDALGPNHRFNTTLMTTGSIKGGVLNGDVYLVGSGDPTLDTSDLDDLAAELKARGVTRVNGRFYFDPSALRTVAQIEPRQPIHAAYNPSLSGLNLNFNRVLMKWERQKGGVYDLDVFAHASRRSAPAVSVQTGFLKSSAPNVNFKYARMGADREVWRVAPRVLGRRGSRWLPVQRPGLYAATALRTVAAEIGVRLPEPEPQAKKAPKSSVTVARITSAPLSKIITGMLKYSTNLTAEALGLIASNRRGASQADFDLSGALMTQWMTQRFGLQDGGARPSLRNHSGLSPLSRITPRQTVEMLAQANQDPRLGQMLLDVMPRYKFRGFKGALVKAKTGTMYYSRGLAGYLQCDTGRRLAFAFYNSDAPGRQAYDRTLNPESDAKPKGASRWLGRARKIERALLTKWTKLYCK